MIATALPAFVYNALPSRVIFGAGSIAQLGAEIDRLGATRALVLCTPEQAETATAIAANLGARIAGTFARAVMHVPIETARDARSEAARLGADCCVAIGGGSTTGLGKAIALVTDLPIVAVPTTYAGSEMTPIYGLTEAGQKKTGRDARVLPKTVIYDPDLTLTLGPELSAASGMNAIAHAVEALYAHDTNPIVELMAQECIRALGSALPRIVADPTDHAARADALYGAWLGGSVLGAVAMSMHHKLCHTLGGSYNLPHAQTHAIMIAHVAAYNESAAPRALAKVARALDAPNAAQGLFDLRARLGLPATLAALGMRGEDLDDAARRATRDPYANPRPVTYDAVRALLQDAFDGRRPPL
jgi:alcohol dehydrogenase class IV